MKSFVVIFIGLNIDHSFTIYRLTDDWKKQRWFSLRHKKQSGPKRVPFNNMSKLKAEYR